MTADVAMLSDDDMPLRATAGPSGSNGNGNGHAMLNGNHGPASSILSSEEEDLPLVSEPALVPPARRAKS